MRPGNVVGACLFLKERTSTGKFKENFGCGQNTLSPPSKLSQAQAVESYYYLTYLRYLLP